MRFRLTNLDAAIAYLDGSGLDGEEVRKFIDAMSLENWARRPYRASRPKKDAEVTVVAPTPARPQKTIRITGADGKTITEEP